METLFDEHDWSTIMHGSCCHAFNYLFDSKFHWILHEIGLWLASFANLMQVHSLAEVWNTPKERMTNYRLDTGHVHQHGAPVSFSVCCMRGVLVLERLVLANTYQPCPPRFFSMREGCATPTWVVPPDMGRPC